MSNFANDLLRALENIKSEDYEKIAQDFFFEEATYWVGEDFKTKEPYDYTPEEWKNMNVSFELLDSYGGEGQGSDYWSVYKFTDNNTGEEVFVKFDGWYASYDGAEYQSCFVVQPREKVVTFYE
jgi:hypothetical protein